MDLRPVTKADVVFLADLTRYAAFPPSRVPEAVPVEARATRWFESWGRPGDAGVVAWEDGLRVGAGWCRVQDDVIAVHDDGRPLPEVAIAVLPGWRNRGIGRALLDALDAEARCAGNTALCLVVNVANPAMQLYERSGYTVAAADGDRRTMIRELRSRRS